MRNIYTSTKKALIKHSSLFVRSVSAKETSVLCDRHLQTSTGEKELSFVSIRIGLTEIQELNDNGSTTASITTFSQKTASITTFSQKTASITMFSLKTTSITTFIQKIASITIKHDTSVSTKLSLSILILIITLYTDYRVSSTKCRRTR
jgi:hypothetical protein